MRAISDPGFRRLFCLVHAEKLTYQVSDHALRSLSQNSQGKKGILSVADLGEGFRGSEPPLSSGNNHADWLE